MIYTIVVADDEEEIRRSLIRKVDWQEAGFQVVGEAENGIEALELVEKLEPDLLLTDLKMPFVSGIELARQVREIRPTMQIAFLSGYDDFTYAQQAIQYNIISYMLKPISAMEVTGELKKIHQKMEKKFEEFAAHDKMLEKMEKSEFLMPLLLDDYARRGEETVDHARLLNEAEACGLIEAKQPALLKYVVIVTRFQDEDGKNCTSRASMHAVDTILQKYMKYSSIYMEGKVVSLLMATDSGFEKYLHILADDISQSVERILGLKSFIGISRITPYLTGIHECYQEAMNAIGYAQGSEGNTVHYISDEEPEGNLDHEMIQGLLEKIENLLRSGTEPELKTYMEKLSGRIVENRISQNTLSFILLQIFSTVYRTVFTVAGSDALLKLQEKTSVRYVPGRGGSIQEYIDICLYARQIISEQRKRSGEILCDQAIRMMQEHFMDQDLSLVSVSNAISVSPNYLSAILKKETGRTFKDILTEARINEAKKLVMYSNLKIREIAVKCGYNDQHYFSYCFKKFTGTSPNGCRRAYEEENK